MVVSLAHLLLLSPNCGAIATIENGSSPITC
jgi:hypothetical protein